MMSLVSGLVNFETYQESFFELAIPPLFELFRPYKFLAVLFGDKDNNLVRNLRKVSTEEACETC